MKQACTPAHFFSNILDPRFGGTRLSLNDIDAAINFAGVISPNILLKVLYYRAKTRPFKSYMFQDNDVK